MFTVNHLVDSWQAVLRVQVKTGQTDAKTEAWYGSALKKLRAAAGPFPAAELRAVHLVAVEFSNHFVRTLKALYRWAVEEELVPKNPFRKLATPPAGERNRVMTRAELVRLYLATPRKYRRYLVLVAHTLARPGELRLLTWGQVRWEDRYLLLTKFKAKDKRRDGVKVRTIPLDGTAYRMLRHLYGRAQRAGRTGPNDPVFPGDDPAQPWTYNAVRCMMRVARVKAGLRPDENGERVVTYTLRHTGATEATKRGLRDRLLADIMGHTTTRTTARYQHLDAGTLVGALEAARRKRPGAA